MRKKAFAPAQCEERNTCFFMEVGQAQGQENRTLTELA